MGRKKGGVGTAFKRSACLMEKFNTMQPMHACSKARSPADARSSARESVENRS